MNNNKRNPSVVHVDNIDIPVTEYQNQRVITTELMAQAYGTELNNIQANFIRNKGRFEEGTHYFKLEGKRLTDLKSVSPQINKRTRNLILWTERGAARHAKMLDTDQAWDVFDKLESDYFEPPQQPKPARRAALPTPTDEFTPEVLAAIDARAMAMSLRQYEHNKNQLREAIKRWGYGLKGQQLVDLVKNIDQKDSRLFLIHRDELWKLTSSVASMTIMHRLALDNVHELEARTGTEWYGRPDNSH
ncbi:ORF6N domain-containing protein [Methylobacter tundripaludum]|uniref:KilA-N, DNA-binding domain protein n=1 Tax=Methylobacter tundripaludum (strain ATCC BAA-1195 / DSM 17260 / SV96) TaxID=697282 RepID=G3IRB0_METTV|nr:ORF6N domain-containing protein [Methylobacter tundripaludum]EGW22121.1 KilA-N, DNA-binding domain protein [Methylobacter tundripaludum SV96]